MMESTWIKSSFTESKSYFGFMNEKFSVLRMNEWQNYTEKVNIVDSYEQMII